MKKINLKLLNSALLLGSVAGGALIINGTLTPAQATSTFISEDRSGGICFCDSYEDCKAKLQPYCTDTCGGAYCDSCQACQAPGCCTDNKIGRAHV
jgi:hypothetical protein